MVLLLVVMVDRADCESLLSGSASESFSQSIPSLFPFAFDDLPFDLPTLLLPGGTANLLLSASLDGISPDGSVSLVGAVSDDARGGCMPRRGELHGLRRRHRGRRLDERRQRGHGPAGHRLRRTPRHADHVAEPAFVPGFGGSQGDLCLGEPCYRYFDSVTGSAGGEITVFPDFDALPQVLRRAGDVELPAVVSRQQPRGDLEHLRRPGGHLCR